jgi:hypothetical protein
LLFVLLFNLTGARAIVTHTVYDGTVTNTQVPVNGDQVYSAYIRSQFIIPADQLEIMVGGKITNMIFYASQDVVNWYSGSSNNTDNLFDVYVSETTDASFTSNNYKSWTGNVYSGKLAINGHQLIVDFNSPLLYSGGNLLIGIKETHHNTTSHNNRTSTFYGQTRTNASIAGTSSNSNDGSGSRQNFVPKTTFVYTPGFIPTNIEVVKKETVQVATNPEGEPILAINATLGWEGDADSYEIRYRTKRDLLSQNFNSSTFPSGWTRWKKGTSPNTNSFRNGWGMYRNTDSPGNNGNSTYRAYSYSWLDETVYDADNWLISPKVELGGILKFDVDVAAWHDKYEVKIATVASIANADTTIFNKTVRAMAPGIRGTEDFDLKDYSGQEGYIAIHHKNKDGFWISIDNFELSAGHAWKTVTTTTNSVVLEHLLPDLIYEYVVVGIKHDDVNNVDVRGEAHNSIISATHVDDVIIPDDEDNESLVYDMAQLCKNGTVYNAYLESRTFRDNGIWNTLCLPFDVTVADSPFKDALIYTVLDRSSVVNGLLTLRIDPLQPTTLKAGTPYLLTWEGTKGLSEPFFPLVTFKDEMHEVTGSVTGGTTIAFKPNFNYLDFEAAEPSILFLSNNNLYSVGAGAKIKPQRGYFQTSDGSPVRGMVFELVDEETAIESVNGAFNNNPWYDLNGRKLTGKPVQKGIYINNGKKTIIK